MKQLALIGLVVFSASCTKHYTCTCRTVDTGYVTRAESYDHVRKSTAQSNCDALAKTLKPPYSVNEHVCKLSD